MSETNKPTQETRYKIYDCFNRLRCVKVSGVRGEKRVRIASAPLVLGCRSRLHIAEWDALGKTPQEAEQIWLEAIRGRQRRAEAEMSKAMAAVGSIEIEEAK